MILAIIINALAHIVLRNKYYEPTIHTWAIELVYGVLVLSVASTLALKRRKPRIYRIHVIVATLVAVHLLIT